MRLLLLLLVACASGAPDDDTDSDVDDTGRDSSVAPEFPVVDDLVATTADNPDCETIDVGSGPQAVPGATGWFVGRFDVDGAELHATEAWVLHANHSWAEAGGAACRVTWVGTGRLSDCEGCTHALTAALLLDRVSTTCPAALVADQPEAVSLAYRVDVAGDQATFSFPSGAPLGVGPASDASLAYVSDGKCVWF